MPITKTLWFTLLAINVIWRPSEELIRNRQKALLSRLNLNISWYQLRVDTISMIYFNSWLRRSIWLEKIIIVWWLEEEGTLGSALKIAWRKRRRNNAAIDLCHFINILNRVCRLHLLNGNKIFMSFCIFRKFQTIKYLQYCIQYH